MRLTTNYVLKKGDNRRRMHVILKEDNVVLPVQPDSAVLRIKLTSETVERNMVMATDPDAGLGWEYHFTDADFLAFGVGNFEAEILADFEGEEETFPTKGYLKITIIPTL